MTNGQILAMEQLHSICASSHGSCSILKSGENEGNNLCILLRIRTASYRENYKAGGILFESYEKLILIITGDFPFVPPKVCFTHERYSEAPHVQWKKWICLYQAPSYEWDVEDGMFGFMQRLDGWFVAAAANELDPPGDPLHPPVAYIKSEGPFVVVRKNTPTVCENPWFGFAELNPISERRIDLTAWSEICPKETSASIAAVVLLPVPMPFEFPGFVKDLISELNRRSIDIQRLFLCMQLAVLSNGEDKPLFLVIGSPQRGLAGSTELKQHLTVWQIPPKFAKLIDWSTYAYLDGSEYKDLGGRALELFWEWAANSEVEWCRVLEDRPEIVVARDSESFANWFNGRRVAILGCGAIGAHIAEFICRAGARELLLFDSGIVTPGILCRQPFEEMDIGTKKVIALSQRLKRIRPDVQIEKDDRDLINASLASVSFKDTDAIIDSTASNIVLKKLELLWRSEIERRSFLASMVIGHQADIGMLLLCPPKHYPGPDDLSRQAKIELCRNNNSNLLNEFWPLPSSRPLFQPEPGCSEPTYRGSAADIASLAGMMLNLAGQRISANNPGPNITFVPSNSQTNAGSCVEISPSLGVSIRDRLNDYEIRIGMGALLEIRSWIERIHRIQDDLTETGGLLFGEVDEVCRIVYVDEASGPPPDSASSQSHFLCGKRGTRELNEQLKKRTLGSVSYLGMWHSHPYGPLEFSDIDLRAMRVLELTSNKNLLMIFNNNLDGAAYVFNSADLAVGGI